MDQDAYLKILNILKEHFDKDSLFFVPSGELRSKLGMSIEEMRPLVENLELNRYIYKREGPTPSYSFLSKIRHKGIDALKEGKVEIEQSCKFHGPEKLKVLELLKREHDIGNPFYTPGKELTEITGLSDLELHQIADEMEYCGLAKKVETGYPYFTMQITHAGMEYLKKNEEFFEKRLRHPKFEIFKDPEGQYRFRLKAVNGEEIASSQAYSSKAACMTGIESVAKNAPVADIVELE